MALEKNDDELKTLTIDILDRHNFYREKHNVPPLKISSKLNETSQDWADELAKLNKASHRPNNEYGENIYIIKSMKKLAELGDKAVDSWYDEIKFFDFQGTNMEMAASTNTRHLTQLIWKDCKELGVGATKCSDSGKIYLVCNYEPPGNIQSRFKENVLPSRDDS